MTGQLCSAALSSTLARSTKHAPASRSQLQQLAALCMSGIYQAGALPWDSPSQHCIGSQRRHVSCSEQSTLDAARWGPVIPSCLAVLPRPVAYRLTLLSADLQFGQLQLFQTSLPTWHVSTAAAAPDADSTRGACSTQGSCSIRPAAVPPNTSSRVHNRRAAGAAVCGVQ